MSEEMKKDMNNENQNNNQDQAPAADQQKQETPAAEDKKPEKVGFMTKVKTFGKEKVVPAAKLVCKGVAKGASIAGGALATAYLIGMAIGGYTAVKGKTDAEATDQEQSSSEEPATAEKPADPEKTDDVQIVLTESNIQTTDE
jgi:hypothetical protein